MPLKVTVEKCGIRISPPALVIVYQTVDDENKSVLRRRIMPIRGDIKHSSVKRLCEELKISHEKYIGSVHDFIIEKMIRLLKECHTGKSLSESLEIVSKEFVIDSCEDLNKLDDESIRRKKQVMDVSFEMNRLKPGDDEYSYDVEVDFNQDDVIETCGWDSDDDPCSF